MDTAVAKFKNIKNSFLHLKTYPFQGLIGTRMRLWEQQTYQVFGLDFSHSLPFYLIFFIKKKKFSSHRNRSLLLFQWLYYLGHLRDMAAFAVHLM